MDELVIADLDDPSDEQSDASEDPASCSMPTASNLQALDIMESESNADDAMSMASGSSFAMPNASNLQALALMETESTADDAVSIASGSSFAMPNASNLQALDLMETESTADDAVSIASGSSFALTYQVLDNDDTSSVASFNMVQEQEQQHGQMLQEQGVQQEQEQQHDPEHHQELQQPSPAAIRERIGQKDAHQLQQLCKRMQLRSGLGGWQEDLELEMALKTSVRDIGKAVAAAAAAAARQKQQQHQQQHNSNSSSSISSNSSSAASAPQTLKLPRQRNQIKNKRYQPRWPLSDLQVPKEKMIPMEKIDEYCAEPQHEQIHTSKYTDASGCTLTFLTEEPTSTSSKITLCPLHHHQFNRHCRHCSNYQHMVEQQQYSMAMQNSIQDNFDQSTIMFIDGLPCCSSHDQDMQDWCGTCNKVLALREEMTA
jgi:hypothetical protein